MDTEIKQLTSDVPDIPLFLAWCITYLGNAILLLIIIGLLSWILQKITGWITTIFTCHLFSAGIMLTFTSTIFIPSRLLVFYQFLPNIENLTSLFFYTGATLNIVALGRLFVYDIPKQLKNKKTKYKQNPKIREKGT